MDIGNLSISIEPKIIVITMSLLFLTVTFPMTILGAMMYAIKINYPVLVNLITYIGIFLITVQFLLIVREALSERRPNKNVKERKR
jgi:hypothetical protein